MRTLLFTDLVDSTQLVERVGDAAAAAMWLEHDRRARQLLAQHQGQEIDRTDGFFLLFDHVLNAAQFALAYQRAMAALQLKARVGIHVGAVTQRQNSEDDVARGAKPVEIEGLAKPFAARIMSLAWGGQTLLSASAKAALAQLPEDTFIESHGHYRLKGVEEPVEVFEIGASGSAFVPPPDTDKVYRVVRDGEFWRPLREVRHNLALERDTFIGRSSELRTLARRLDNGSRLLTVLGPGGTGKTRLVRRYGLAWLGDWPGGVYFCDLSEARSLDGIYFAVAWALGVPLGKDDPGVQLGHAIAGRGRCLVILDNFEQVVQHASASLGRWLDRAADASFVVTSRELLHLVGEVVLPVEPLELGSEAIELFAVRAQARHCEFRLNPSNQAAVAEVVRLLDGLPLAIELAAARASVLSPAQMVERMAHRFQLLAGARGAAARQATLKAAIDWSWDLLAPWEQAALAQCSVFEGGFTLDAAEAVVDLVAWSDAPAVMDAIQSLVDKSLLRAWLPTEHRRLDIDEPYFGMYLSIHEYASDKLGASGPAATLAAHARHGRYFAGFGTNVAIDGLSLVDGVKRFHMLALELDNLVIACRRATSRSDVETAVATYRATWQVLEKQGPFALGDVLGTQVLGLDGIAGWPLALACLTRGRASWRTGHVDDATRWFEQALALARSMQDQRLEGEVLNQLGSLQSDRGAMVAARASLEGAYEIHRELGERRAEGVSLGNLANAYLRQGQMAQARKYLEAACAIACEVGNRHNEGLALGNLAIVHKAQGRLDEALAYFEQALAIHREVGNRFREGIELGNMGNLYLDQGRMDRARTHHEAALVIHREVGNRRSEGIVLCNLGILHSDQRQFEPARECLDAALATAREVGNRQSEGLVLCALSELHLAQGRRELALKCCEDGLAVSRTAGDRQTQGSLLGQLGALLFCRGRVEEASDALRAGEVLLREIGDRLALANLLCIRGLQDAARHDLDAARAALTEAEATAVTLHSSDDSGLCHAIAELRGALV